ncbi:MAG: hypothetical protein BMS9Abin07_0686 [Acidimicrobiia bacterium]|nr:MAG: hypothetical protein BMS9Abin07_0686 [Acidimicrobiia bacterium]
MPLAPHSATRIATTGPISRTVGFIMVIAGWTASLATVLGLFGAKWWPLDVLADWRLPLGAILIVAAVITGLGYSRGSAVVFLAAAIFNVALIAPMYLQEQPQSSSNERIRVVSLDVGKAPDVRPAVLEWVNTVEADIVVLVRAGGNWSSAIEQLNMPYRVVNDPGKSGGILVLGRNGFPVSVAEDPVGFEGVDAVITTSVGDQEITILGLSVERPVSARAAEDRIRRFETVGVNARKMQGPVVIVGNLEASRWSYAFKTLADGLTNSEDGYGYAATYAVLDWPLIGEYAGIPVDHVLYTGPVAVTLRKVGPDLGIDHRPLLVHLSPASG